MSRIGYDIKEPASWPPDFGARREPVVDKNQRPPRIVRHVGHARCLRCTRWFFSRDVIRIRICDMCKSYLSE